MSAMRILIVEDNDLFRKLALKRLEKEGFEAEEASDILKAVQLLRHKSFNLVIADLIMERELDMELLRQLRELLGAEGKLIVMLEHSEYALPLESLDRIADECLYKPVELDEILHIVRRNIKLMDLEKLLAHYRLLAVHDDLTKIYNRRFFDFAVARETARAGRSRQPVSLLLIDMDDFKYFNDTHGRHAGDLALEKIAGVLKLSLRGIDTLCRYGDEEFAAILPDTGPDNTVIVAERLRRIVERTNIGLEDTPQSAVTASIGAAGFPQNADGAEKLVFCAAQALENAKKSGKNKIVLYSAAAAG